MIVKDVGTVEQAMDLIKVGPVYYSTNIRSGTITSPDELRGLLEHQIDMGDIAIVTSKESYRYAEDYDYSKKLVAHERRIQEQKNIRKWVTEHPDQARKIQERMARAAQTKETSIF